MTGFGGSLRAEGLRLTSRRLFRGLVAGLLAMIALQVSLAFFFSSNDPDSGLEEARMDVQRCVTDERLARERGDITGDEGFDCPSLDEARQYYDKRFNYVSTMRDAFQGLGVLCLAVGLVVGAAFIGAEYGSGSMTILLTWEARRGRVLATKTIASMVGVALSLAVMLVLVAVLFYPVATLRGTSEGMTSSFWWTQTGLGLRDVFLGVFGCAIGVSLATFVRSTAGAVGIGFFYGAIVDQLLGIWRSGMFREWVLSYNVARLLGLPVPVDEQAAIGPEGLFTTDVVLSASRPAIVLTIYGVVILAIAYAAFRKRDVA